VLDEGGIDPDQLAQLARRHGVNAAAQQLHLEAIASLVQDERFPVVLLDRSLLDREFAVHAVIPVRFSKEFVVVLDPLRGERRISRRKFAAACQRVERWAVVWE
jgi:ABC-type bacteriocin/lantibiotic exporter with double-glycine peptidase domain